MANPQFTSEGDIFRNYFVEILCMIHINLQIGLIILVYQIQYEQHIFKYRKFSNIRRTKSPNFNVSRLV